MVSVWNQIPELSLPFQNVIQGLTLLPVNSQVAHMQNIITVLIFRITTMSQIVSNIVAASLFTAATNGIEIVLRKEEYSPSSFCVSYNSALSNLLKRTVCRHRINNHCISVSSCRNSVVLISFSITLTLVMASRAEARYNKMVPPPTVTVFNLYLIVLSLIF